MDRMATLVLLRHGESEWNSKNLFTGWVDVDLTAKGEQQARSGGVLLAEAGLLPEWYMPIGGPIRRTRSRRVVVVGIIVSLLLVNGAGLCVTYGMPEIAW